MDKKLISIFPLIAIVIILQILFLSELTNPETEQLEKSYQSGYDRGLSDAVNILINETKNCNSPTIFSLNQNVTLVDIQCIP
ncbi:MAG: hypothetical protein OEM79_04860 [Nitrosopumilus sp.]|nr:hypothetical protein [Nitrosopumilus sp.]